MRHLFTEVLPVGKRRDHIEHYFNELEKLIFTTDDDGNAIQNEQFDDGPDDGIQRNYQYFSPLVLEERAGRHQLQSDPQSMDTTTHGVDFDNLLPSPPPES